MSGMITMARLELMLRFRAGRWRWLLLSWFLGLVIFSVLLEVVIGRSMGYEGHEGTVLFGGLQLFMLALALIIVPALTSQSVNGDREQGRLGVLQVTELTPIDIIGGKLLAAWGTACVFVIVSAPITIWAMVQGGITIWQVLRELCDDAATGDHLCHRARPVSHSQSEHNIERADLRCRLCLGRGYARAVGVDHRHQRTVGRWLGLATSGRESICDPGRCCTICTDDPDLLLGPGRIDVSG